MERSIPRFGFVFICMIHLHVAGHCNVDGLKVEGPLRLADYEEDSIKFKYDQDCITLDDFDNYDIVFVWEYHPGHWHASRYDVFIVFNENVRYKSNRGFIDPINRNVVSCSNIHKHRLMEKPEEFVFCDNYCKEETCSLTEEWRCPWDITRGYTGNIAKPRDGDDDGYKCCCKFRRSKDEECGGNGTQEVPDLTSFLSVFSQARLSLHVRLRLIALDVISFSFSVGIAVLSVYAAGANFGIFSAGAATIIGVSGVTFMIVILFIFSWTLGFLFIDNLLKFERHRLINGRRFMEGAKGIDFNENLLRYNRNRITNGHRFMEGTKLSDRDKHEISHKYMFEKFVNYYKNPSTSQKTQVFHTVSDFWECLTQEKIDHQHFSSSESEGGALSFSCNDETGTFMILAPDDSAGSKYILFAHNDNISVLKCGYILNGKLFDGNCVSIRRTFSIVKDFREKPTCDEMWNKYFVYWQNHLKNEVAKIDGIEWKENPDMNEKVAETNNRNMNQSSKCGEFIREFQQLLQSTQQSKKINDRRPGKKFWIY